MLKSHLEAAGKVEKTSQELINSLMTNQSMYV